jgi:hypothetical protein
MAAKSERSDLDGLIRADNNYTIYGACRVAFLR